MKIKTAVFDRSAPDLRSCPQWAWPEFALIGRSNVGKSSLVNFLTERRDLAKVSDLPGKTQLINFFVINGTWVLVDLPGYGYASVSEHRRLAFNEKVADFLQGRENLRLIFVLIDSRHPPQKIDLDFLRWLDGVGVPYALIFTKTDKLSSTQGGENARQFLAAVREWRAEPPQTFATSSKNRTGRGEVLNAVAAILSRTSGPRGN